jgi:ribonuclease R
LANVAVAELLADKEVPAVYRIHEEPTDEQWAGMAEDLMALDIRAAPRDRLDLQRVTRSIAGTPVEYAGNLAVLRNLKRAVYSGSQIEHFGLAFEKYTHFTSPIRRYPDLVVHRILCALEQGLPSPYTHDDIERLTAHCSDTERNADEAEEESLTVKRVEFYANKLARGDIGPFPALITGMVSRGLLVELIDTLQRGLAPFATMTDDFYTVDRERGRAVGRRRRRIWKMGQPVEVELIHVDTYRRLLDFRIADSTETSPAPSRPERRKKRHRRR